jgi:hypothetical protein
MSTLNTALGNRIVYLRRAWMIPGFNQDGYIMQEDERDTTYYVFSIAIAGEWKRLTFKEIKGRADIYLAVRAGIVVSVAMESDTLSPSLMLMIEDAGTYRWWIINWLRDEVKVLLVALRTPLDPFAVVV